MAAALLVTAWSSIAQEFVCVPGGEDNSWRQKLDQKDVRNILDNHQSWLSKDVSERREDSPLRASFCDADLPEGIDLRRKDLSYANLIRANLNNAYLHGARLVGTDMRGTILRGAYLDESDVGHAIFEPSELPVVDSMSDAKNLHTLRFIETPRALVALRRAFRDAGFRQQEREVTRAIQHSAMLQSGPLERTFNFVLFELTTEWGMAPGRALWALGLLIPVFAVLYMISVRRQSADGIWRIWSGDRIRSDLGGNEPERMRAGWWGAIWIGLYFSVLSAFHIGWRDLNVGNWISRIQGREYALRATGWVRTVSGIQSLISVYLLAIWALTYFGRPFE